MDIAFAIDKVWLDLVSIASGKHVHKRVSQVMPEVKKQARDIISREIIQRRTALLEHITV